MQKKKKNPLKRAGLISLCCCFLFFFSLLNCSAGQNIVRVVVSSGAGPYVTAADALTNMLKKQSVLIQSFTLDAIKDGLPAPVSGTSKVVWVAIGSRAADVLNSTLAGKTPLVYCMVAKPELIGLKGRLDNVAGVSITLPVNEQFSLIRQALPDLKTIGMLYRSTSPKSVRSLVEVQEQLPEGWRLQAINIDASGSMAKAIQKLFNQQVDLIWTAADSSVYNRSTVKALLLASLRNNTPVFGFSGSFVKAGALLGLEADPALQGEYAAALVQQVFGHPNKPKKAEMAGVNLAVNMIVADRLGISLPAAVVQQARVIGNLR